MNRYLPTFICLCMAAACQARIINVDDDGPADFNNIQAAINDANNGNVVLVAPGEYITREPITFRGKTITVQSEAGPEQTMIRMSDIPSDPARASVVIFENGEKESSVLEGFTLTNGKGSKIGLERPPQPRGGGVLCWGGSPTLKKCRIVGNSAERGGGVYGCSLILNSEIYKNSARDNGGGVYDVATMINCRISGNSAGWAGGIWLSTGGQGNFINCLIIGNSGDWGGAIAMDETVTATLTNCTVAENRGGGIDIDWDYTLKLTSCILRGNIYNSSQGESAQIIGDENGTPIINYCDIQGWTGAFGGEGNFGSDPLFAKPGYWDDKGTPQDPSDDFWVEGDYHLKSQAGRWDVNEGRWTKDEVTSPCIDAGDPHSPIGLEPFPNGGIINMGAYGGTAEASKSYFGKPVCETIVVGDINGDCKVDLRDFAIIAFHWLEEH